MNDTNDPLRPTEEEALAAWARRVGADREQVDRLREIPDPADFYGPVSSLFRADPHRTDDPTLEILRSLARPGETWLDIGAGAGRFALPLGLLVRQVIAVEPSKAMTNALREQMADYAIWNVTTIEARWPIDPPPREPIRADVALIAHVGYDIELIGPFLDAIEEAADRLCVVVLMERQPSSVADPFWPPIHGEPRVRLPALFEFLVLLTARNRSFEVRLVDRPPRAFDSEDQLAAFLRRQLWIAEGGSKDRQFRDLLSAAIVRRPEGVTLTDARSLPTGIVTWRPPHA